MTVEIDICKLKKLVDEELNIIKKKSIQEKEEIYSKITSSQENIFEFNFLLSLFTVLKKEEEIKNTINKIFSKNKIKLTNYNEDNNINLLKKNGYSKIKKIGEGYFGKVYLCFKNKKKYAIKLQNIMVNIKWIEDAKKTIENLIHEYKLGKKLGSKSISPKFYEIFFNYNSLNDIYTSFIQMEYIKGENLESYMKKNKLTSKQKKKLSNKIEKLHKLKIYHNDLHPGNIMVVKKNKDIDFFIVDLGLALDVKGVINKLEKNNKRILSENNNSNEEEEFNLKIALYNLIKSKKINFEIDCKK